MPDADAQREAEYRTKVSEWDDVKFTFGVPLLLIGLVVSLAGVAWFVFKFIRGGLQAISG